MREKVQEIPEHKDLIFDIKKTFEDKRIDRYLAARLPNCSRTFIQKLIKEKNVLVSGRMVKSSYDIQKGDIIHVRLPVFNENKVIPEDIPINIVYEDDYLMLINKPYDMVVHPAGRHLNGTLVNALAYYCQNLSQVNGSSKAGIVHRLDRDTTGIMLVIKSDAVHSHIAMQFEKRLVRKEYLAVVEGEVALDSDEINLPIGRHRTDRQKMSVRFDIGKEAISVYEVIERFRGYSLVRVLPKTGRTHQIRVHMKAIGHPIVADSLYSKRTACYPSDLLQGGKGMDEHPVIERQALHAYKIEFFHPIKSKKMEFRADLPHDMSGLIQSLRKLRPLETAMTAVY